MPVILKKKYPGPVASVNEEIMGRIRAGDAQSFLYIAPTKRKIRELQREFLKISPRTIAPAFNLYTLETLAAELYSLLCPPRQLITATIQSVLVDEAIRSSAALLRYFRLHGRSRRMPTGTLRRIINVLNVLREHGVYRSTLLAELETAEPFEKPKLQDILTIYDAYESLLGDRFVDSAGLYKHLNGQWDNASSPAIVASRFPRTNLIYISGFDEFSDPELTMLSNLSDMNNAGMIISFDYHPDNDEVFGHLKQNYSKFMEMGFSKVAVSVKREESITQHVIDHLFRYNTGVPRVTGHGAVTVVAADSRVSEVEHTASIIKSLAIEKPDRDLSKICVSMFGPERYTKMIREVFDRFGIPANITDRYYLDESPLVISILSLLSVLEHDYRLHDIMRVCSSPYLKIKKNGKRITAGNISDAASILKILRGRKSWFKRINQHRQNIERTLCEISDDFEALRLRRETETLTAAEGDLTVITELLKPFGSVMTPVEFKTRLTTLLEQVEVSRSVLEGVFENEEKLEKDTRAYQKFLSFIDEFLGILSYEGEDARKNPLSFYLDRLRETITQVRYNIRQKYGHGVAVTSFDETRGLQFDVMIIIGMVDGEFPPPYQPEIFFSTERRAQYERYHLHEHRYLFYQAMTNFTEHVFLIYPETDGQVELVPSSFIDAVMRMIDVRDCRLELPAEIQHTVYSTDALIRMHGQLLRSNTGRASVPPSLAAYEAALNNLFDHIRHSIDVEIGRVMGTPEKEYNGQIGSSIDQEEMNALARLREQTYSITQLESYGACPFQYFANRILRLNAIQEVEEELTSLERGGVLHEILFEFYRSRRERGALPLRGIDNEQYRRALQELLDIAVQKLNELHIPDAFWEIDKERILGSRNRKGILREFLDMERENTLEVTPRYFEVAFGSHVGSRVKVDPEMKLERPIIAGTAQLRGKIDRIDMGDGYFRIVDYKTGSNINGRKELDLGVSLQLPVYLFAVEYMMAKKMNRTTNGVAGVYHLLRSPVEEKTGLGNYEFKGKAFSAARMSKQIVANQEELSELIAQAIRFVNEYVDNISAGNFPVAPKIPVPGCNYCDYRTICRIRPEMLVAVSQNMESESE